MLGHCQTEQQMMAKHPQEPAGALLQRHASTAEPSSAQPGGPSGPDQASGDAEARTLERHLRLPPGGGARRRTSQGQRPGADVWAEREDAVSDATGLVTVDWLSHMVTKTCRCLPGYGHEAVLSFGCPPCRVSIPGSSDQRAMLGSDDDGSYICTGAEAADVSAPHRRSGSGCCMGDQGTESCWPAQVIRQWLLRGWRAALGAWLRMWEFLRRICSAAERPLHFVKVQLAAGPGAGCLFLRDAVCSPITRNSVMHWKAKQPPEEFAALHWPTCHH